MAAPPLLCINGQPGVGGNPWEGSEQKIRMSPSKKGREVDPTAEKPSKTHAPQGGDAARRVKNNGHVVKSSRPRMQERTTWVAREKKAAACQGQFTTKKHVFKSHSCRAERWGGRHLQGTVRLWFGFGGSLGFIWFYWRVSRTAPWQRINYLQHIIIVIVIVISTCGQHPVKVGEDDKHFLI